MNSVKMRHVFDHSKSDSENPTLSENTETHEQDISERIIQFPA